MDHICPVCGYHMKEPPRDFNICPSCGTEFGYDDISMTHEELRRLWLDEGAQWWSEAQKKPAGWDPYNQLISAGLVVRHSAPSTTITKSVSTEPLPFLNYKVA